MALRGTNQEVGRSFNRRTVLETIRLFGPISRAEIAEKVGLTVQTVTTITHELLGQQLLSAAVEPPRGRGQPPTTLTINPAGGFTVGLSLSPAGIEIALVDLVGAIVERRKLAISLRDPAATIEAGRRLVEALCAGRRRETILGMGIAIPGPQDVEPMSFVGSTTLEGWRGIPIADRFAAATGLPTFLDIDLTAAALGDLLYGIGRGFSTFYYLYFGAGLGGRFVQGRSVLGGHRGNAGEVGHMTIVVGGDPCPCGNRGCLERYVSLDALERRLRAEGIETAPDEIILGGSPIFDAWLAEVAPLMQAAIVSIENLFDPETIIIGGHAPRRLIERLVEAAEPLPHSIAERPDRSAPRITLSDDGVDAVLRGAAALAVSGTMSPAGR
ncbi:ROK family transcriptional regulator [Kaistia dalseonensis]|uniref:NBD/HSP70 family sugar kinase n=1 Tax=Kaistia dalseonensis TaxID=410840 RepID=A0ABU0HBW1_9HYPH|nr:ROK family transcriptional regulator [Kaistia dalseonensis]MCX5496383.1 ROK family transcriptional regulator [Kaistia dalseonensis]MDQ0439004.1 putative NBD/HSP70 family sugar kinase [Kaistia dalseonensis]